MEENYLYVSTLEPINFQDWASHKEEPATLKKNDALVFIIPGLTGSSDEPYLR